MHSLAEKHRFRGWPLVLALLVSLIVTTSAWGHGAKGHSEETFNAFQAAQKGMQLFDTLLSKGKIDEGFETDLATVEITGGTRNGKPVIVTKFERAKGEPKAVFIFFDLTGKYVGSNFTGN